MLPRYSAVSAVALSTIMPQIGSLAWIATVCSRIGESPTVLNLVMYSPELTRLFYNALAIAHRFNAQLQDKFLREQKFVFIFDFKCAASKTA